MARNKNQPDTLSGVSTDRSAAWASDWGLWFTAVIAIVNLFWRFHFNNAYLAFYEDDFFYYAQVARNIANYGISSFDGIHLTNGYHPLWLVILTGIYKVAPGKAFFYLLQSLEVFLNISVYVLTRRCLLRYTSDQRFASLAAAVAAFIALGLARGGMEVSLTVPLVMLLISYRLRPSFRWSGVQMLVLGFLSGLVILSRLDSGVLILLIFVVDAFVHRFSIQEWIVRGAELALGAWPVAVYLLINQKIFATMMPVSGQAKGFRFNHLPSLEPIKSLATVRRPTGLIELFLPIAIGLVTVILLLKNSKKTTGDGGAKAIAIALLAFPVVHLAILSVRSDWPLWLWYFYPLAFLIFAGAITLVESVSDHNKPLPVSITNGLTQGFVGFVLLFTILFVALRKPNALYLLSADIAEFASTHPGTYAMGDRGGTPGFMMQQQPIIQLEGLVMDKHFLSYIESQADLAQVFRDYGVTYYIATDPPLKQGCYNVLEPAKPGPNVPKMHGVICKEPVAIFAREDSTGLTKEYVFDVRGL
jgi:hypothetical protein